MKTWKNMQIFIMRHGQASSMAVVDANRPLTNHGIDEVTLMANWLKSLPFTFDKILISPFKRAQQTANTLALILNTIPSTTLDFITPSGSARELHDYIDDVIFEENAKNIDNKNKEQQRILIVSHMPLVSYLVAELTQQQSCPIFQTAAIAEIKYDEDNMTGNLEQLISPDDLNQKK